MKLSDNLYSVYQKYYRHRILLLWAIFPVFFVSFFLLAEFSIHFNISIAPEIQRSTICYYLAGLFFLLFELHQHKKLLRILSWLHGNLYSEQANKSKCSYWSKETLINTLNNTSVGYSKKNVIALLQAVENCTRSAEKPSAEDLLFLKNAIQHFEVREAIYEKSGGAILSSLILFPLIFSYFFLVLYPPFGFLFLLLASVACALKTVLYLHHRSAVNSFSKQ